jgi:hypothetical protein
VTSDNSIAIIDQNWICKSELGDGSRNLFDLLLGMGSGVGLAWVECGDILINDRKGRLDLVRCGHLESPIHFRRLASYTTSRVHSQKGRRNFREETRFKNDRQSICRSQRAVTILAARSWGGPTHQSLLRIKGHPVRPKRFSRLINHAR